MGTTVSAKPVSLSWWASPPSFCVRRSAVKGERGWNCLVCHCDATAGHIFSERHLRACYWATYGDDGGKASAQESRHPALQDGYGAATGLLAIVDGSVSAADESSHMADGDHGAWPAEPEQVAGGDHGFVSRLMADFFTRAELEQEDELEEDDDDENEKLVPWQKTDCFCGQTTATARTGA